MMFDITVSSHSDVGDVKKTNQDSILYKNAYVGKYNVGLYIIADGCGGLAYGEEISRLATTYFVRVWNNELKELLTGKKGLKSSDVDALLEKAIRDINDRAVKFGGEVGDRVGTTLSLLLSIDNRYYIKNVGDSRIYLKRGNKLKQLTQDQSLVADLLRNKEITKEEAENFRRKNVLTMCIGVFKNIRTYSIRGKIRSGDVFVICCDGLYNRVDSRTMLNILKNGKIPQEGKAEAMRRSIPEGKANDNVSVIACKYIKKDAALKIIVPILALLAMAAGVLCKNRIHSLFLQILNLITDMR